MIKKSYQDIYLQESRIFLFFFCAVWNTAALPTYLTTYRYLLPFPLPPLAEVVEKKKGELLVGPSSGGGGGVYGECELANDVDINLYAKISLVD